MAPPSARITAYDTLAAEYNRIAPGKQYPITDTLPEHRYDLVTLFNCLDHMNDPGELLRALRTRLSSHGQLWIWCHIDQPFSPEEHPQDFRFWHLVSLVHGHFDILKCGLTRDGKLYPYVWWCIAGVRREAPVRAVWKAYHTMRCAITFARFHARRALVKAGRIMRGAA